MNTSTVHTSTVHTPAGLVTLEPLALDHDTVRTLHAWLDHPGSAYWGMRGTTPAQVEEFRAQFAALVPQISAACRSVAGK